MLFKSNFNDNVCGLPISNTNTVQRLRVGQWALQASLSWVGNLGGDLISRQKAIETLFSSSNKYTCFRLLRTAYLPLQTNKQLCSCQIGFVYVSKRLKHVTFNAKVTDKMCLKEQKLFDCMCYLKNQKYFPLYMLETKTKAGSTTLSNSRQSACLRTASSTLRADKTYFWY